MTSEPHAGGSRTWPLWVAAAVGVAALLGAAALLAPRSAQRVHATPARATPAGVISSASPTPTPTPTTTHPPTPTPSPTAIGPVVATASSQQGPEWGPANVLDGKPGTRWSSAFRDGQWLAIDLGRSVRIRDVALNWENAYARSFRLQVSDDGRQWRSVTSELAGRPGMQHVAVHVTSRRLRVLGLTRATEYGFSLFSVDVSAKAAADADRVGPCLPGDVARGQATGASSEENADSTPARNVTDGDPGTRWSSGSDDAQWVQVDLGAVRSLCTVTVVWERAFAAEFRLQASADGVAFRDITGPIHGHEGAQRIDVSGDWRVVRMAGIHRATEFGYSLFELAVTARAAS